MADLQKAGFVLRCDNKSGACQLNHIRLLVALLFLAGKTTQRISIAHLDDKDTNVFRLTLIGAGLYRAS